MLENARYRVWIVLLSALVFAGAMALLEWETRRTARELAPSGGTEKEAWEMQREAMVKLIESRGVRNPRVLNALREVERHRFVPKGYQSESYADHPLPIGEGQTISQPYIVGLMTDLLDPEPGHKVLEIGTGSGYQAAVLARVVKDVYTIEIVKKLGERAQKDLEELGYDNVHVRIGDGYRGWPAEAPFDGVIVTAAPEHVPQPLIDQLKVGGRLVIPVGPAGAQQLEVLIKTEDGVKKQRSIPVRFVPMTGEAQKRAR